MIRTFSVTMQFFRITMQFFLATLLPFLVTLLIFLVVLLTFLLAAVPAAQAQPCPQFPANCPDNTVTDRGSPDDSVARLLNPLIPQEVAMENRLRQWAQTLVNSIAQKEGWEVVEIADDAAAGYRNTTDAVLAYDRRPAHWFHMTWQFIVSKDSLQAWRDWLTGFSQRRLDATQQYMSNINAKQGAIQAYMDSANYWGDLMAKYMTSHIEQYQKDLVAGNKTGISTYEKGVEVYRKRQDGFLNKAAELQKDPSAEKASADADQESNSQKLRHRDATVVILEFDFNNRIAQTAGNKVPSPPGSAPAIKWYANPEPELLDNVHFFTHSRHMALWLIGAWAPNPDRDGSYQSTWSASRDETHTYSNKKIKCDKVQNLFCQVSGNAAAMRRILADLPADELEKLITRP